MEVELLFGKVILEHECGLDVGDVGAGMNVKSLSFKSSYAGQW